MTTTKRIRKMTKLERAEKKNIDHNKKLATKARKKLSTTLNWMDVKKLIMTALSSNGIKRSITSKESKSNLIICF